MSYNSPINMVIIFFGLKKNIDGKSGCSGGHRGDSHQKKNIDNSPINMVIIFFGRKVDAVVATAVVPITYTNVYYKLSIITPMSTSDCGNSSLGINVHYVG